MSNMFGSKSKTQTSSRTSTDYTDRRKTETLNAGISGGIDDSFVSSGNHGDTEITSDSSRRYYNQDYNQDYSREYDYSDNSDNSMDVDMEDNSDRSITDNSDRSFTDESDYSRSWEDNSDRSSNWEDNSDRSFTDESDRSFNDSSDRSFNDSSDSSMTVDFADSSDRSATDNSDNSVDNSVRNITDGGAFDLVGGMGDSVIEFLSENQDNMYEFSEKVLASSDQVARQSLAGAMNIKAGQAVTEPANQTVRELADTGKTLAIIAIGGYVASQVFKG
ncbi:hypothetical protein [Marinimicrobium sp. C2-29]|uniref:hypothetical protein n=1 Tax=Marinimicrobium sp. C2-29 TaxID=3139825 RepID=UPI003139C90C